MGGDDEVLVMVVKLVASGWFAEDATTTAAAEVVAGWLTAVAVCFPFAPDVEGVFEVLELVLSLAEDCTAPAPSVAQLLTVCVTVTVVKLQGRHVELPPDARSSIAGGEDVLMFAKAGGVFRVTLVDEPCGEAVAFLGLTGEAY